jgi:hypothetical protein
MSVRLSPLARALAGCLTKRQQDLDRLYELCDPAELDSTIMELARAGLIEIRQARDGRTLISLVRGPV